MMKFYPSCYTDLCISQDGRICFSFSYYVEKNNDYEIKVSTCLIDTKKGEIIRIFNIKNTCPKNYNPGEELLYSLPKATAVDKDGTIYISYANVQDKQKYNKKQPYSIL